MTKPQPSTDAGSAPTPGRTQPDADVYAAAVYGSIVATALVAAFREHDAPSRTVALSLVSTMAVFWLAHVWSAIVGERIHVGRGFDRRRIGTIARAEWPLVEAAFAPASVLLLGWGGILGDRAASATALVVCLLQLFGWGFVVGRRAYERWWEAAISGLMSGVLGIVLVSLEMSVIH